MLSRSMGSFDHETLKRMKRIQQIIRIFDRIETKYYLIGSIRTIRFIRFENGYYWTRWKKRVLQVR